MQTKRHKIIWIFYIARPDQGVINIDGLDTNSFSKVSTQRLSEVKSRFASDFAKI